MMRFLDTKYNLDSIYGYDIEDAEAFKRLTKARDEMLRHADIIEGIR